MEIATEKQKYMTSADSTIEEAWGIIEMNNQRSVIVVEGSKVVGTLSDGDIRKAVLSKRLLIAPVREVMNLSFVSIKENEKENAGNIFREKNIFLLPVVDAEMNLLDVLVR